MAEASPQAASEDAAAATSLPWYESRESCVPHVFDIVAGLTYSPFASSRERWVGAQYIASSILPSCWVLPNSCQPDSFTFIVPSNASHRVDSKGTRGLTAIVIALGAQVGTLHPVEANLSSRGSCCRKAASLTMQVEPVLFWNTAPASILKLGVDTNTYLCDYHSTRVEIPRLLLRHRAA